VSLPCLAQVNPIEDSGLLLKYSNPANMFPLIIVGTMGVVFAVGLCVAIRLQRRDKHVLEAEMKAQFLADGELGKHIPR